MTMSVSIGFSGGVAGGAAVGGTAIATGVGLAIVGGIGLGYAITEKTEIDENIGKILFPEDTRPLDVAIPRIPSLVKTKGPKGRCSKATQAALQEIVTQSCKKNKRSCEGVKGCESYQIGQFGYCKRNCCRIYRKRAQRNAACVAARITIQNVCFNGVPDKGHLDAINDARKATQNCLSNLFKHSCFEK
jgi:hypothetical protein